MYNKSRSKSLIYSSKSRKNAALFAATILLIAGFVMISGCTGSTGSTPASSDLSDSAKFHVTSEGILVVDNISYTYRVEESKIVDEEGAITYTVLWMNDGKTDVYATLAAPKDPKCAVVFSPGAGEKAEGHFDRLVEYAKSGVAFMYVDTRGNGGNTSGAPLNIQNDYALAVNGMTPGIYLNTFDLIAGKNYLKNRFGEDLKVYAVGSSNGGRYACMAASVDSGFAGYIGVSTSGFEYTEGENGESVDYFIRSVNPNSYISLISPRPVLIMHSATDPIIEFNAGLDLYNLAKEPKDLEVFEGDHGLNVNADKYILGYFLNLTASA